MSPTVENTHSDYRDALILARYRTQTRTIHEIAQEFGVSALHVTGLIREAQLAGQREEAQEMAKHVEDYGDVLWAVPAGQLGYRSGSSALCKQVEAARAEHPDAHVLVAVCIAPKVERITVTDLPAEPQPERIQAAAVNNKKGCVA